VRAGGDEIAERWPTLDGMNGVAATLDLFSRRSTNPPLHERQL
jgi:hypothetical protein